jgi:hypothetical protein
MVFTPTRAICLLNQKEAIKHRREVKINWIKPANSKIVIEAG